MTTKDTKNTKEKQKRIKASTDIDTTAGGVAQTL
jgi:hypothetical protein